MWAEWIHAIEMVYNSLEPQPQKWSKLTKPLCYYHMYILLNKHMIMFKDVVLMSLMNFTKEIHMQGED